MIYIVMILLVEGGGLVVSDTPALQLYFPLAGEDGMSLQLSEPVDSMVMSLRTIPRAGRSILRHD